MRQIGLGENDKRFIGMSLGLWMTYVGVFVLLNPVTMPYLLPLVGVTFLGLALLAAQKTTPRPIAVNPDVSPTPSSTTKA